MLKKTAAFFLAVVMVVSLGTVALAGQNSVQLTGRNQSVTVAAGYVSFSLNDRSVYDDESYRLYDSNYNQVGSGSGETFSFNFSSYAGQSLKLDYTYTTPGSTVTYVRDAYGGGYRYVRDKHSATVNITVEGNSSSGGYGNNGNGSETGYCTHPMGGVYSTVTGATCSQPGKRVLKCVICGAVMQEEEIPKTDHQYRSNGTLRNKTLYDVLYEANLNKAELISFNDRKAADLAEEIVSDSDLYYYGYSSDFDNLSEDYQSVISSSSYRSETKQILQKIDVDAVAVKSCSYCGKMFFDFGSTTLSVEKDEKEEEHVQPPKEEEPTVPSPSYPSSSSGADFSLSAKRNGNDITVKVNADNAYGLAAYRVEIGYDPSVLRVKSVDKGDSDNYWPDNDALKPYNDTGRVLVIGSYWMDRLYNESATLHVVHFEVIDNNADETVLQLVASDCTYEPYGSRSGCRSSNGVTIQLKGTGTKTDTAADYMLGDVDNDKKISAADARLALRCSVGLEKYEKGSKPFRACDVDKDGIVSSSDARMILRVSVGLEQLTSA